MKKIFLFITLFALSQALFAQSVKYGLQAGVNLPTLQPRTSYNLGAQYNVGVNFQAGTVVDIGFGKYSIQPGLSIIGKGNKSTVQRNLISYGSPVPYEVVQSVNLWYVELPLNALYHIPVGLGNIYIGAGPYAAYAISGQVKNKTKRNIYVKNVQKEDVEFGNGPEQLKQTDFGGNVLGGIELKNGLNVGINYGIGLNNLSNISYKSYNRVASFKVGYFFSK